MQRTIVNRTWDVQRSGCQIWEQRWTNDCRECPLLDLYSTGFLPREAPQNTSSWISERLLQQVQCHCWTLKKQYMQGPMLGVAWLEVAVVNASHSGEVSPDLFLLLRWPIAFRAERVAPIRKDPLLRNAGKRDQSHKKRLLFRNDSRGTPRFAPGKRWPSKWSCLVVLKLY